MKHSLFKAIDFLFEEFESIDRIDTVITRTDKKVLIYLNERFCCKEITIASIKEFILEEDFIHLHFIE